MERLSNVGKLTGVEKLSDRWMYYSGLLACMGVPVDDMKHIQNLIDAEEQEKLIRLPCKVGDTLWWTNAYGDLCTSEVNSMFIEQGIDGIVIETLICNINGKEIGKTVFLNREQAEKKINE